MIDTRKKFNTLIEVGFTKEQAEVMTALGFAVHFKNIDTIHEEYMKECYCDV